MDRREEEFRRCVFEARVFLAAVCVVGLLGLLAIVLGVCGVLA